MPAPSKAESSRDRRISELLAHRDALTRAATEAPSESGQLGFAQARMYFLHLLDPHSAAYDIRSVARLAGELDLHRLERALRALLARHPMLRSRFVMVDGTPRRETLDLDAVPPPLREVPDTATLYDALRKPFDIAVAPLLRVIVTEEAAGARVVALHIHHLVADGWSLGILHRELHDLYAEDDLSAAGHQVGPESLDRSIAEERSWVRSPDGVAGLDYWRRQLADLPTIELPMTRAGHRGRSQFAGRREEVMLDVELAERLEGVADRHGASLYVVVVAAFSALLHRYTGQRDLVVGTPVANRGDLDVSDMIGLFTNTVCVRLDVHETATFTEVLTAARTTVLEALQHQQVPFELVVNELNPPRTLDHNPLFQVLVAHQNAESGVLRLPGTTTQTLESDLDVARLDIECTTWRLPTGLRVRLSLAEGRFHPSAGQQMLADFQRLLRSVADDPQARLADLAVFDDVPPRSAPACPAPPATLWDWFTATADAHPYRTAVSDADLEMTFRDLQADATAAAAWLQGRGVQPGDRVGIALSRNAALVAATLGVTAAGAAFVPINPEDPRDRVAYIVADSAAGVVLTDDDVARWRAGSGSLTPVARRAADPAYVLYTSGTTGRPKGVEVAHGNIVNTLHGTQSLFGIGADDVGLVLAASTFDVFYYELFSVLLAGGHSRVLTKAEIFTPTAIVGLLHGATRMQAVPGLMEHVLSALGQEGVRSVPTMRQVMTGGDKVPPPLLERVAKMFPAAQITITYGPTETAIFASHHAVAPGETGYPLGEPLPGVSLLVADDRGVAMPPGVAGEIWIGGAGVANGYVERPELTAATFVLRDGERFYRSGDRGVWDPGTGRLEFRGRTDKQVKVRGLRIELGEIEAVLSAQPEVRQGVVLRVGDGSADSRLVGYVTVNEDEQDRAEGDRTRVEDWRQLFDQTHVSSTDTGRDFTGWNSSYDGLPLPEQQMDEWLDETLATLRSLVASARELGRPVRVLEVGTGTGLIATELAPDCDRYTGVDFSAAALAVAEQRLAGLGVDRVDLHVSAAHDLDGIGTQFDLVVINSVAQYFPSIDYLTRVITAVRGHMATDARLFVGDVRSLPLLDVFHASVLARTGAGAPSPADVANRVASEPELVVDPRWFTGHFDTVQAMPKFAPHDNELTKFRYDVVLGGPGAAALDPPDWARWSVLAAEQVDAGTALAGAVRDRPDVLAISDIPNELLAADLERAQQVAGSPRASSAPAISPHRLRELAAGLGYDVQASVLAGRVNGDYDAVLTPSGGGLPPVAWPPAARPPGRAATDPTRTRRAADLGVVLRGRLHDVLAAYMVPDVVIVLEELPLTANDKVDTLALPVPNVVPGAGRRPRAGTEQAVADAFRDVLTVPSPSASDDLFQIGGTSLTAIRIAVALRESGLVVTPQQLFEHPTVERLAHFLDRERDQPLPPAPVDVLDRLVTERPGPLTAQQLAEDEWASCKNVMITGATGFLGAHLLAHALQTYPQLTVWAPVRAANDAAAGRRLTEALEVQFGAAAAGRLAARTRTVAADLTHPGLGLAQATRAELAARLDAVVHAAADVRHVADRGEIWAANVGGTRGVLQLCTDAGVRMVHISTIGVAGRSGRSDLVLSEADLEIGQTPTEYYSASKIAAERMLRSAPRFADAVTVVRVGTVGPHSVTGRFQRNMDGHFLGRLARGMLALGVAADWPGRELRVVPADAMAAAVFGLTGPSAARGSTFHLQSPHPLPHSGLAEVARELGFDVRVLDVADFVDAVTRWGADGSRAEDVGRLLPWLSERSDVAVRLDSSATDDRLRAGGFSYPEPHPGWLRAFLEHGIATGYLPAPPTGALR